MATYKGIQGYSVQKLATDPTAADAAGQLWYNSTDYKFKISVAGAGAWAAGGSINNGRNNLVSCGPNSATIMFGGWQPTASANAEVEEYDGTTWTETSNLLSARGSICAAVNGTQTAALCINGNPSPANQVEKWDGTSWTAAAASTVSHSYCRGAGTSTAALAIGSGPSRAIVESYDGTAWTTANSLTQARYFNMASGTQTAALNFGGDSPPPVFVDNTEEYDGTCWTETSDLNTARATGGGAGSQTAALCVSGNTPTYTDKTEKWDGTSWTEVAVVATARIRNGTCGTSAAAITGGGQTPPVVATVEIWTDPVYAIKTVTVS